MTKEESEPGEAPERDRRCVRLDELTIAERERVRAMERLANARIG
jgi:hypothetical protein